MNFGRRCPGLAGGREALAQCARPLAGLLGRRTQHGQRGNRPHGFFRFVVAPQGGLQRQKCHLVDTIRAHERVDVELIDQIAPADDDAALWTPEQFITGKTDQIGAGLNGFPSVGFVGQSEV